MVWPRELSLSFLPRFISLFLHCVHCPHAAVAVAGLAYGYPSPALGIEGGGKESRQRIEGGGEGNTEGGNGEREGEAPGAGGGRAAMVVGGVSAEIAQLTHAERER
jgi:hypothetical protein